MSDDRPTCSIVLCSTDMDWMHAFKKGVYRFFMANVQTAESLAGLEKLLEQTAVDLIILAEGEGLPGIEQLRSALKRLRLSIPVLMIVSGSAPLDSMIKQGADYALPRRDILSAIKMLQQVVAQKQAMIATAAAQKEQAAINSLYQWIYKDLPDPVCYLQDGLFIDANPAFLNTFKVKDHAALDELTIMNFVPLKAEKGFKRLMKMAMEKEVVPAESFELEDRDGERLEMTVQVASVTVRDVPAVQVFFRSASRGGGSGGGVDPSTNLPSASVLKASIKQTQDRQEEDVLLGTWVFFWLENYREVLQKDGYRPAEILIRGVVDMAQRLLPPSTEMVRFSDDGILMWISGDKEQAIVRIQNLVTRLDDLIPDNIGRLIHPHTFAGMLELRSNSIFEDLVSRSFRAVKSLSMSQSQDRVAEPAAADISRKDERRVNMIKRIINDQRIALHYQPICALEVDGQPRYADRLEILPDPSNEAEESDIETDILLQVADRFGLGRDIERFKFSRFLQDFLSYSGNQSALIVFISLMADALNDETFPEWLDTQFNQTGINPQQLVFEIRLDTLINNYSGASRLIETLRPLGARFAISEIGRIDDEVNELFKLVQPEVIKLDIREIDTFEDDEEDRFMAKIKEYAEAHNVMLIADHMESPAQLSRVWPHDIGYLQGDGMVPPLDGFYYDFDEPLF